VPHGWPAVTDDLPWLRLDSERDAMIMRGEEEFRHVDRTCWDADARLADMDADGVDVQVLSPTPVFFSYAADAAEAVKIAHVFNDLALEICAPAADRLLPFCQVPLQDPDLACAELERCLAAGHRGVEIGNHVGERDLDDAGIVTFLQHAASLDVPVFVHPWDMLSTARTSRWMAQWLTGMPAETHLSLLAMVLGGVFDALPPSLRICFAHGGGSFAFWLGRMDNAWHQRPDVVRGSEHPPSHYVDRFSVDTLVFSPEPFRLLVESMGRNQVMVGSDYPYPFGERPVGRAVRSAGLDDRTTWMIETGNAQRFLGILP
jgi:aminocarboxymuconate-semialdehyde decarboxylase